MIFSSSGFCQEKTEAPGNSAAAEIAFSQILKNIRFEAMENKDGSTTYTNFSYDSPRDQRSLYLPLVDASGTLSIANLFCASQKYKAAAILSVRHPVKDPAVKTFYIWIPWINSTSFTMQINIPAATTYHFDLPVRAVASFDLGLPDQTSLPPNLSGHYVPLGEISAVESAVGEWSLRQEKATTLLTGVNCHN